ncbi:hypothetical protein MKW92_044898, partial [Papaver armeniacum]
IIARNESIVECFTIIRCSTASLSTSNGFIDTPLGAKCLNCRDGVELECIDVVLFEPDGEQGTEWWCTRAEIQKEVLFYLLACWLPFSSLVLVDCVY